MMFARAMLWVLSFNILASMVLPVAAAEETARPGLSQDTLVLCTPNGIKLIRLDANGDPVSDKTEDGGFCAFCLPVLKPLACTPAVQAVARLEYARFIHTFPVSITYHAPLVSGGSSKPRAPPIFLA